MPGPHVDDKKGKKVMVYKARKDIRKRGPEQKERKKEKSDLKGMSEETYCCIP